MHNKDKQSHTPAWWLLGATGLLQPLSEEFLYRSPRLGDNACWRRADKVREGGRDA